MKKIIKEILSKLLSNFPDLITYTYFRRKELHSFFLLDYHMLIDKLILLMSLKINDKEGRYADRYRKTCNEALFELSRIRYDGDVSIRAMIKENKKVIKEQELNEKWLIDEIDDTTMYYLKTTDNNGLIYEKIRKIYEEELIYLINDRRYFNNIDLLVDKIIEKY